MNKIYESSSEIERLLSIEIGKAIDAEIIKSLFSNGRFEKIEYILDKIKKSK